MTLSSPSEVVQLKFNFLNQTVNINIPKDEGFLVKEIFEQDEYDILPYRSHSGPLQIFDIGGNVGLFAIYMKMKFPDCNVFSFEPTPSNLALFSANTESFKGITIRRYGLYNQEKEADLYIHPQNSGMNSVKIFTGPGSGTTKVRLKDAATEFDKMGLEHLDVLKIDTEGCEIEILESMGNRLADIDYILVEYHSESDRRNIDHILKDFHVYSFRAVILGLGTVSYINSRLLMETQKP